MRVNHGEVWMSRTNRAVRLLSVFALIAGLALMLAAYGVAGNRSHAKPTKSFGTLRAVLDTIDYLDPQQAYTGQSWWSMWNVWETLITYRHVDGPAGYKLVPGLARSLPTVSSGGRKYTFFMRKGVRYSNGKRVKASDFKYAIKREFLSTGQGVGFYTDIVGAEQFSKTLKGDIGGIQTNNKTGKIVIRLTKPRGDFLTILSLLFAAPVPAGTPNSIQNGNIPATGPYKITGYEANRGFTMVRNKYFKPTKYVPKGNPNRVEVALIGDANAATQRVISGQADYSNGAIPPDRIASVKGRGQLVLRKTANTYYTTIGNINTKAQTGWARWLEDYPHPLDWFDVLLNGNRIVQQDNNNYAYFSNKKVNSEIEALKKAPVLTPAVNAKWAVVEKQIMQQAPWAPWSNRVFPEFFSKSMGCIHVQRLYGIDLARLCKK